MTEQLKESIEKARHGDYKQLAEIVYSINKSNGYWDRERTAIDCCVLANTEINEAIEAWRRDKYAQVKINPYYLDRLTNEEYKTSYKNLIKDTFESELAGCAIRCLDWMGHGGRVKPKLQPVDGVDATNNFLHDAFDLQRALLKDSADWACYFLLILLDYTEQKGIDLWQFVEWEVKYNSLRGHKSTEGKHS